MRHKYAYSSHKYYTTFKYMDYDMNFLENEVTLHNPAYTTQACLIVSPRSVNYPWHYDLFTDLFLRKSK